MGSPNHLCAVLTATVVAVVLALGGCSSPDSSAPRAASSPAAVPTKFGTVLSHSAPQADVVFAVTDGVKGCPSCVSLWRRTSTASAWAPVATLPRPEKAGYDDGAGPFPPVNATALAMAPDGKHGYLAWDTDGLLATGDGGRTWLPVTGPDGARARGSAVIDGGQVLLSMLDDCGGADCADKLWRARLGSVDWQEVTVPLRTGEGLFDLRARAGALNGIAVSPEGESLLRSTDRGATWTRVTPEPNPCAGCSGTCTPYPTGTHATVARCMTGDSWTDVVRISTDGQPWRDLARPGVGEKHQVQWVVAVDDDQTFLLGTASGVLRVDAAGDLEGVVGLRRGGYPGAVGFVTAKVGHILGEDGQLTRSEDGGRTWVEIAPARTFGG
ncbi:WD40/YVTN/BNR-like repeat-containing protein [Nocardioides cavernaquae]|uniref:WD40/YVTN/BNR-like repeat-containing protein n=1 Tax=Nocardioides cavernaquae TaxID=2321396 RepID=UPI0011C45DA9|nr:hypothetical protein [Nocardioides cavernaquae]